MSQLKLKSLILCGFKSFADRTVFDFHDGMTVLVGPNGCGKSNIVDAIKWVLGDQSAKSVRGKEMVDVIFNGSEKRPPMGFAEVSLVFDNKSHNLPIDYESVMVTRKIMRDGHSEYEINRNSCRLKDVRELFMDTGIGVDAYSIIEQGRVAAFIQANAKERRQIFEEASGISRLKSRKKEALAKLNRSEQNLERLHDIVDEVTKRLARVHRQAEKAQKYKDLTDSFKKKRVTVAVFDYHEFSNQEKALEVKLKNAEDQLTVLQSEQSSKEAKRLEMDEQLALSNRKVQQHATELVKIDGEIHRLSDLIERHKNLIETIQKEHNRRQQHLQELGRRRQEIIDGRSQLNEKINSLQEEIKNSETSVKQIENRVESHEEKLLEFSNHLESLRSRLNVGQVNQQRFVHMEENNRVRLERLNRERLEAKQKQEEFNETKKSQETVSNQLEQNIESNATQKRELEQKLLDQENLTKELNSEVMRMDDTLTEIRLEKGRKIAERRVLEDLERHHAGLSEAVKSLLEEGRSDTKLLTGLVGLSAELVKVTPKYAKAVDAALGAGAQIVVVDDLSTMLRAEQILIEKKLGQVAFAPLEGLPSLSLPPLRNDFPHLGRLVDQIEVESAHRLLLEHLLGMWYLVEEKTDLSKVPAGVSVVTASGRRRGPRGTYVIGPSGETTGLVSRRSRLQELESTIQDLEKKEFAINQSLEDLSSKKEEHETRRSDLASEVMKLEGHIADKRSDLHVLKQEMRLLQDRLQRLTDRLSGIQNEHRIVKEESEENQNQLNRLKNELPQLAEEIQNIQQGQQQAQEIQEKEREALVAERMNQNSLIHENQKLQASLEHQNETSKDLEEDQERLTQEGEEALHRLQELKSESQLSQESISENFKFKESAETQLHESRLQRSKIEEKKQEVDEVLGTILPQLQKNQGEISRAQIDLKEVIFHRNSLVERIQEDYQLNLIDTAQNWETTSHTENFDIQTWRQECEELKTKIEALGAVNLDALQEEVELDDRYKFLAHQEKDLKEATYKLREVVQKIDSTARDLFTSTFEAVREHFKVTFRQLFGGGRADLKLDENESDILEAGIEITACPPGKEPRSITLLSGGEKTMTAVALLFAVFKSRPSPFCILDEVDAALDESNIDRWLAMLDKFKDSSQFLVITHSKRTMKDASMIYGVTMQEPGVSCKLSLKFEEINENEDLNKISDNKVA